MAHFFPSVLQHQASTAAVLAVDAYPDARQGSFSFCACGDLPMQDLCIVFSAPDGSVVHRVFPRRAPPRPRSKVWRASATAPARWCEYLLRRLLRMDTVFHLDLDAAQLCHPALSVRIENQGHAALIVGRLRLRSSKLARDRLIPNRHAIEGYSQRVSVAAGAVLPLYVHAPSQRFSLQVIRYGARAEALFLDPCITGFAQDYRADAHEHGARWHVSYMLAIAPHWRSGLYAARLTDPDGSSFDITFIVRNGGLPAAGALAVLASTNTWQAYNDWGGASLYHSTLDDGLERPNAFIVHSQRPNPAASPHGAVGHLANAERHVLAWLERHKIAFDLYADIDLHERPELLQQYPALLINTHSEYWSAAMYQALTAFQCGGGNLIYLSGNGLYWKAVIQQDRMEVRFDHSCHTLASDAGGRWRDFGRPEWRTLGVAFTRAGYRSRYAPYKVLAPDHWVFDGTGLTAGALVGAAGLNCGGASGWEIDKLDPLGRPSGLVHLAKGTNPWRAGADMVCFPHPGGGAVFSVGSITFGGSLAVDPVLSRMLQNVIARFTQEAGPACERPQRPLPMWTTSTNSVKIAG
ncbi:MAG: N,N-dimethylformamidase beta subunit family domain-containing protein [Pseudomonadota bacterium]